MTLNQNFNIIVILSKKIKLINRCNLKHFKTVIMSSYKTFQSATKCHKVSQSSLNTHLEMVVVVSGEWWAETNFSV